MKNFQPTCRLRMYTDSAHKPPKLQQWYERVVLKSGEQESSGEWVDVPTFYDIPAKSDQ